MPRDIMGIVGQVLGYTWWLWAFFILFPVFRSAWRFWRGELFKQSNEFKCILLEIRMPREVKKSPKAMEQVLFSINQLRNVPGDLREFWWDGEITKWVSLEMVSFGGEVHFYIRHYYKQRPLIEAAFFSYYADVELQEVDDYVSRLPNNIQEMYEQGYDLWGTEMILRRDAMYPIKTYTDFEAPEEEGQFDPISTFIEVLGKVKRTEIVGIQMLLQPLGPEWANKYEPALEKLRAPKMDKKSGRRTRANFPGGVLPTFETAKGEDAPKDFPRMIFRSPGETDVLKFIEENLSKPAFQTLIRFIYLTPDKPMYDSFARRGLVGSFNQYATTDMNSFVQNYDVSTRTKFWSWPHIFPKLRNEYRKERLLYNYRKRELPPETAIGKLITSYLLNWNFVSKQFVMNTKGIATLFHPPTFLVTTAPHIKRVESRKTGPPAGLAIFGDEKEIEKYQ